MSWKLWLDDQLDDIRPVPLGFIGARSSAEAIDLVDRLGPPGFMNLDHDLGGDDTAMVFLKYLAYTCDSGPPDYIVHSQNPIGRANIVSYIESWKKSRD